MKREAIVIGAGVSGLTSAMRLRESGWRVHIWAAELPDRTNSAVAAALWYPYRVGPANRVNAWGKRSFAVFAELANDGETGVRMSPGVELLKIGADPSITPDWAANIPGFR